MSSANHNGQHNLKVIILAAGKESGAEAARSILLKNLGSHKVIDYVVHNALQLVPPEDIYVVVSPESEAMRQHLGESLPDLAVRRDAAARDVEAIGALIAGAGSPDEEHIVSPEELRFLMTAEDEDEGEG